MLVFAATAICADIHAVDLNDVEAALTADYCNTVEGAEQVTDSEPDEVVKMLHDFGRQIAADSESSKQCEREFRRGNRLFERSLKRNLKSVRRGGQFEPSDDAEILSVQQQISRLWMDDQAARRSYVELKRDGSSAAARWAGARATAHARQVDARALTFVREALDRYDWIDRHRFGNRTSRSAWLLVQHADQDPALQTMALDRMQSYLENDGVRKRDYAYLWDRVAVNHGRLQRFGTQPVWECVEGKLSLQPIEDPESVDERRQTMGLGTVQSGLLQMSMEVCGK